MQRMQGDVMLEADSFDDNPTHTPKDFRRCFRMNKEFMKIVIGVRGYDDYFMCKKDCTRLSGFTSVQKCTSSLRCLAYGAHSDT
jgi:hypothetical protein